MTTACKDLMDTNIWSFEQVTSAIHVAGIGCSCNLWLYYGLYWVLCWLKGKGISSKGTPVNPARRRLKN